MLIITFLTPWTYNFWITLYERVERLPASWSSIVKEDTVVQVFIVRPRVLQVRPPPPLRLTAAELHKWQGTNRKFANGLTQAVSHRAEIRGDTQRFCWRIVKMSLANSGFRQIVAPSSNEFPRRETKDLDWEGGGWLPVLNVASWRGRRKGYFLLSTLTLNFLKWNFLDHADGSRLIGSWSDTKSETRTDGCTV